MHNQLVHLFPWNSLERRTHQLDDQGIVSSFELAAGDRQLAVGAKIWTRLNRDHEQLFFVEVEIDTADITATTRRERALGGVVNL